MSEMISWKEEPEERKWKEIENTPEAIAKAIKKGAMFLTWASQEPSKNGGEPIRRGDFPFAFDCKENPQKAFDEANRLIEYVSEQYDVDPNCLSLHASGGKGCHLTTPAAVLGASDGHPHLHLIYKQVAETFKKALGLKTMDTGIYAGGMGKMFRLENVKRKNGRHKIPLTFDEFKSLPYSKIDELCLNPRQINAHVKPVASLKMVKLFNDAKKKIESGQSPEPAADGDGTDIDRYLKGVKKGERNTAATTVAGLYINQFLDNKFAYTQLEIWNKQNDPPLDPEELKKTFESILDREMQKTVADQSGFNIVSLIKRKWPNGDIKWLIELKVFGGKPQEIELTTNALMDPRLFEQRMAEAINRALMVGKKKYWYPRIDKWMKNAPVEVMSADETEISDGF